VKALSRKEVAAEVANKTFLVKIATNHDQPRPLFLTRVDECHRLGRTFRWSTRTPGSGAVESHRRGRIIAAGSRRLAADPERRHRRRPLALGGPPDAAAAAAAAAPQKVAPAASSAASRLSSVGAATSARLWKPSPSSSSGLFLFFLEHWTRTLIQLLPGFQYFNYSIVSPSLFGWTLETDFFFQFRSGNVLSRFQLGWTVFFSNIEPKPSSTCYRVFNTSTTVLFLQVSSGELWKPIFF